MGAVKGFVKSFTGSSGDDAARDAANIQAHSGQEAIKSQERALEIVRGDLSLGREQLDFAAPLLQQAIQDPSSRVLDNPFFQALAGDQEQRLLASRAARGKVGSGGTEDQLQRNLLLLGNQFQQQDVGNLFNLCNVGRKCSGTNGNSNSAVIKSG